MSWVALTREVSRSIGECQLTHLERSPIDVALAREQHAQYEQALRALGCVIMRVAPADRLPDAVFVEDTAIVLDEVAIIARPAVESRRAETVAVVDALMAFRSLRFISAPGTLDGGDVLKVGRDLFIGESSRTNRAAIDEVGRLLAPYGYRVTPVAVTGCLHLKSAITAVDEQTLLVNPAWVPGDAFRRYDLIPIHPDEPSAANVLMVGSRLLSAAEHPKTREVLLARGYDVTPVFNSELAKAEGAVSCGSLIFRRDGAADWSSSGS